MAKAGRKRNYEAYVRDYQAKKKKLEANGVRMNQRMYSEDEFNNQYERLLSKRKDDVAKGKRKTTGNITRDLIDKQAFALSSKQVEAMRGERARENYYLKRSGQSIGEYEFEKFNEYMNKHPDAEEEDALRYARKEVSTEFFGS